MSGERVIEVAGEGFRSYEVRVGPGLIADAGGHIAPLLANRRTVVITDATVAPLHLDRLRTALARASIDVAAHVIPAGEASKSFGELERLCDRLLAENLDRRDVIVALGGGVVGDLAGFAAAIVKRGVDFVQIPTTLLAQVDSSVGGKTAIDTPRGKNLIGAFWQPRLVLCDLDALSTLPEREMRAGYAEVLKYGLLGDRDFFEFLERDAGRVLALDPEALIRAVAHSVEMKAVIVGEDAREAGKRALLNLGHTFGHALEAETGFGDGLLHGEAVALGCAMAFRFSSAQGLCPPEDTRRAESAIAAAGLPILLDQAPGAPFSAERLIGHMLQDKKSEGGSLVFVLARAIGQAFVARDVDAAAVRDHLIKEGARP
ncbi:MAG TPA: 3-dehydroquinate synthase [Caulobacteraceae bacterium]|jgi:3-dehydroquinate synthase|nr:3-dehydroquinate synthase [Caulobacteraceae bacterium]